MIRTDNMRLRFAIGCEGGGKVGEKRMRMRIRQDREAGAEGKRSRNNKRK